MKKLFLIVLVISLNSVFAGDISVNGSVGFDFLYLNENSKIKEGKGENWDDFVANINGNSFITYYTEDLFSITCDIDAAGSLKPVSNSEETNIAPVDLNISQLYINFIVKDFIFYVGKKKREIGGNGYFNVSNRISPKFSNLGTSDNSSLGMVEVEWLLNDKVQLGSISYFTNSEDWENVSLAPYMFLSLWPFTFETYLYFEEMDRINLGYNIDTQLSDFSFYIEGILKEKSDLVKAGKDEYLKWTNSVIAGLSYSGVLFSASLEYLYNNEGWSFNDFDKFYLDSKPSSPLFKNYVVMGFGKSDIVVENLSFRLNLVNSLPELDLDTYSLKASASLTYSFNDLRFTGYFQKSFGGSDSEYISTGRNEYIIGLFTTFYY